MDFVTLLLISVGLAMDAFAVSICKGLAMQKVTWKNMVTVGLWFGGFQALMPLLGYFLGSTFAEKIAAVDHWIAFGLLALIGLNMIREAVFGKQKEETGTTGFVEMLLLAIATSIDALAVGVTFAFMNVNIWYSAGVIGVVTFLLSAGGVKIGSAFGSRYSKPAEIIGGVILILIGLRILLKDLGILSF